MSIFKFLKQVLNEIQFRLKVGFWKYELKNLFIVLMNRDDEEFVGLSVGQGAAIIECRDIQNGNCLAKLLFKNNVIKVCERWGEDYIFAVGGNYEDASFLNVMAGSMDENDIVLKAEFWRTTFKPGPWQKYIKVLIKELL